MLGGRDRVARQWRNVAVCEIHLGVLRHSLRDRPFAAALEAVPADVRDLQGRARASWSQPSAGSGQQAEAWNIGSLFAVFEQPLHAQTDAEQRATFADSGHDGF